MKYKVGDSIYHKNHKRWYKIVSIDEAFNHYTNPYIVKDEDSNAYFNTGDMYIDHEYTEEISKSPLFLAMKEEN